MKTLSEAITWFRREGRLHEPSVRTSVTGEADDDDRAIAGLLQRALVDVASYIIDHTYGNVVTENLGYFLRWREMSTVTVGTTKHGFLPADLGAMVGFTQSKYDKIHLTREGTGAVYWGDWSPDGTHRIRVPSGGTSPGWLVYNSNLVDSMIEASVATTGTTDGKAWFTADTPQYGMTLHPTNDWYEGLRVKFTSGNAIAHSYFVTAYDASTAKFTLERAWDTEPQDGDTFGTVADLPSGIAEEVWIFDALLRLGSTPEQRFLVKLSELKKRLQMSIQRRRAFQP